MHVLPLPFGMAVVLLPRRHVQQVAGPNPAPRRQPQPYPRDLTGPEGRYAELRQLLR